MRVLIGLAIIVAALGLDVRPGQAGGDAPWCAIRGEGGGSGDCHYQTVEECAPTVIAGVRGFCTLNPAYVGPASSAAPRKQRGRRG